jgi:glyoxylase-like metal-dependent hydrolase (beta-lactamase superfamily II)
MRPGHLPAVVAAALLLGLAWAAGAQQGFEDVVIRTIPVRDGLYMLTGRGGNLAVSVGDDGTFLVDDQFAPLTAKILAAIAKLTDDPVRFVVNTHWHGDHTGGNERLGRAGAVIVAHGNVRKRMSVEQFMSLRSRTVPPAPSEALPIITFAQEVTFHLNGDTVRVFHVSPAHTDGDAVVHFRGADVIHAGDLFFNGLYPFIDLDSGGSTEGAIAAANRILELAGPDTAIIPGHGPLSDAEGLRAARDMLVTVRDRVRAAIREGESLEQLKARRALSDLDPRWGGGFLDADTFLSLVYRDLAP